MEDDELSNEKFEQISISEKLTQNFNETKMNDLKSNINLIKNTFRPDEINKINIQKYITLIKLMSTIKTMKEDTKPIEIIDNVFIGSIGVASKKEILMEHKITHIVVAAANIKTYFPNDFTYLKLNLLDSINQDIKQYFIDAGEFIEESLKNNGRVLVHCFKGISRSSTIILSYLIKYKNIKLHDALQLAKSKREIINPNPGFLKQLKEFENTLVI